MEIAHGQRERHGQQPHAAGARDRGRGHFGYTRRFEQADRGRSAGRAGRAEEQPQPDDRESEVHYREELGAGLVEDQPRQVLADDAGTEGSRGSVEAHYVGADAARLRAPRRLLHHGGREQHARAEAHCQLRLQGAQAPRQSVLPRRRTRRTGSVGKEADSPYQRSGRLHQDLVRIGRGAATQRHRATGAVRRRSEGSDRTRLVPALQSDSPALPRPARRDGRRRDQHDRGEHENRGAAGAVAEPHPRAAESIRGAQEAAGRAQEIECRARGASDDASYFRRTAQGPAGRAAAGQRGARRESLTPRRTESESRVEERGSGGSESRARGESRAAVAQLEVQVGVPREHVTRAAHSAQQPAHSGAPPERE